MMKYLSIVIFLVLMVWTWTIVHRESSVPFETHAGIQNKMVQVIADTVKSKKPDATDIFVDKIWTELVSEGKVRAHFSYSFKAPTSAGALTESQITGEGMLEHQPDDGSGFDRWKLYDIKTTSDAIRFEEALLITTGDSPATSN